eukprot:m.43984 g.43984  ORF g.43984 m.43984 type:complete len:80 (-) comp10853_c0_seq1:51-290(-)
MALIAGVGQGTFTVAVLWVAAALVALLARRTSAPGLITFGVLFAVGVVTIGLIFAPRETNEDVPSDSQVCARSFSRFVW